jgi:hypothetical protein
MKTDDLRNLIQACPRLTSFYYHCGSESQGPHNPSPAKMIELLEPLKDSLEALSLELESEYTEDGSIEVHDGRLDSLAHMTALQILDTSAEMWKYLCADELELEGLDPYPGYAALPTVATITSYPDLSSLPR